MTEKNTEEKNLEIEAIKRPDDMDAFIQEYPKIYEYLAWLEDRNTLLQKELEANPGREARGIFWIDVFGTIKDPRPEVDLRYQVKGNLTQRSDVSGLHAARLCFSNLQAIRGEYAMKPYMENLTIGNGRKKPSEATSPNQQDAEPAEQESPKGRRKKRTAETAEPSKTKTEESMESEQWIKVRNLEVALTRDKKDRFLRVRLDVPKWKTHGKPAYLDSSNIPEDVVAMIENKEWTVEHPAVEADEIATEFPDMQYALVSADEKKIVGFSAKPPQ